MNLMARHLALKVLRETDLEKVADEKGIIGGLGQAGKGILGLGKAVGKAAIEGGKRSGEVLTQSGHPMLGGAARLLPYAGGAYLGYKGLTALKKQHELRKYRKALRQQQGY